MTPWEIKANELINCNCAYGCPCQFNALPTYGNCEAVGGFQIESGFFGDIPLDGLRMVGIMQWPGAIHEGRGKAQAIIDETADEGQRSALLTIVSGDKTDPGATMWNVFAATMEHAFSPLFKPIDLEIDVEGRTGYVRVQGLVDIRAEPIRNPVTGEPHRARINLPDGFEYTLAEMGSATSTVKGNIPLNLQDSYAQLAHIHLNNHGLVR